MRWNRTLRGFGRALPLIVSALLWTSCKTCPPAPEPLPVSWPSLAPPPQTGIELAPDGRLLVPLDYWLEVVGYIRELDLVRASLERQNLLIGGENERGGK